MGLLYSNLKIFHFKEKIDSLGEDVKTILPPVHVRLKPTNACNHSCRYCAYRSSNLQLGEDMRVSDHIPSEKMETIVDDLAQMGVKAVTFSGGGEPFCYPYLAETMKRLAEGRVNFASLTNGALMTGESAEVLAHRGTWVRVSMDGWDDHSYSEFRRVKDGEFTRVLANIDAFKKLGGGCVLGVNFVVTTENHTHLFEFAQKVRDVGADSLKVSPCIVSNDGRETNAYHRPIFHRVKQEIERVRSVLVGSDFELYDSYHELENNFSKQYDWCPYLQILAVIGADLNVYSCQDKAYNLSCGLMGSIKDRGFREFWEDGKDKFFGINPMKDCNHHCVADGKNHMLLDYLNIRNGHSDFV